MNDITFASAELQEFLKRYPKPSHDDAIDSLNLILQYYSKEHLIAGVTDVPRVIVDGVEYIARYHLNSDMQDIAARLIERNKRIIIHQLTPMVLVDTSSPFESIADAQPRYHFYLKYCEIDSGQAN